MKFLVLDDQLHWREKIERFLTQLGHTCVVANDGRDICQATHKEYGDADFDGVITDMRMSGGDGIYVLQWINDPEYMMPCYIHSTENSCRRKGREIDLRVYVPQFFGKFATYGNKPDFDETFTDLPAWIDTLTTQQ